MCKSNDGTNHKSILGDTRRKKIPYKMSTTGSIYNLSRTTDLEIHLRDREGQDYLFPLEWCWLASTLYADLVLFRTVKTCVSISLRKKIWMLLWNLSIVQCEINFKKYNFIIRHFFLENQMEILFYFHSLNISNWCHNQKASKIENIKEASYTVYRKEINI